MTLPEIGAKLAAGRPLDAADADLLADADDLLGLGVLADEQRRRRHGDRTTFVRVQEIPLGSLGSSAVEIAPGAGEVRLAGGAAELPQAVRAVRRVAQAAGSTPVTGFAVDDLAEGAAGDPAALGGALSALQEAGLAAVAEARLERLDGPQWLEVVARAGLRIGRLTIDAAGGPDALALLRRAADWGGALAPVQALAPLPRASQPQPTTGYRDLRQVALARLLVDNIDSIQVDWSLYGPKLAQVALLFGADDVDAVSPIDDQSRGPRRAPREEIVRNIRASALTPVERNGRFEDLER